jgi:tripartite-type tricarboxylate transporter receptor subunit TctC
MNSSFHRSRRQWLVASAVSGFCQLLSAQEVYPARPVNLMVPFPPGGLADSVARLLAPSLERALGQAVVVMNRAGAAGAIGAAAVATGKPDGYSVLFTLSSLSTLPEQAVVNQQKPAFLLSQLRPIARVSTDPLAIVVRAESSLKSLADLLTQARAKSGEVSYGSSGNYGTVHVPIEIFSHEAQVKLNHIPYAGGGPLMVALLGGQVDFTMLPRSSIASQMRAGKLRILATVGADAWPQFPSAQSTSDAGLNVEVQPWTGAFVSVDTPAAVVDRLRSAFRTASEYPEFKQALLKAEGGPAYLDAAEFKTFWDQDAARLTQAVRRMGKLE